MSEDRNLPIEEQSTEDKIDGVARALWIEFTLWNAPVEHPTWGELLAQGHQGAKRVAEFRAYALAAIQACAHE